MKFYILFALACVCPVAFSHNRYIAIPVSALINGKPNREGTAVVYDINPLQVRDPGTAGRSRSSSTSTAVRRTSTTGGRLGGRSAVTSTAVRNSGSGSIRRIASGTPTGSIRRIASGTRAGSIRRVAGGTPRGTVNMITRPPAITRTVGYLPSGTGAYVNGNVRYISSVSPSYTSGYVNSVYQPHIVAGLSYQPSATSTGYYVRRPNVQRASYVLNAAIQQPFTNSQYLGLPQYQSYMHNQPLYRSIL
ncbi:uncharacterized protein LOC110464911 [Mizuhopecten yessoensis]|uniref:uncharacterized protein LOC110464911 n=1 Tax=Mizuhopecten yessoensis TaxID=6573 RepID=UPI000B4588AE|nr:uncharacterized protein LOC110464911 [Mizuhopecten yessoensis]